MEKGLGNSIHRIRNLTYQGAIPRPSCPVDRPESSNSSGCGCPGSLGASPHPILNFNHDTAEKSLSPDNIPRTLQLLRRNQPLYRTNRPSLSNRIRNPDYWRQPIGLSCHIHSHKMSISAIIICLTSVTLDTSLPELIVNTIACPGFNTEIPIENHLDNNIANTLLRTC
jgi:Ca2+/Na+ antiporter